MALEALVSFWQWAFSDSDISLCQWVSTEALKVSRWTMASLVMTLVGREVVASHKQILSPLEGLSPCWLLECWVPQVVVFWGKQLCKTVLAYWTMCQTRVSTSSSMLGLVTVSLGHSVKECREEIGIDDCWEVAIVTSPWVVLGRFTCNMAGLLVDSISQTDCLGRGTCISLKPPFRPSRYTTSLPHWRSLQTSRQLRHPQVLLLGAPSTMMLMCLASERGMCWESSHNCTKV